MVRHLILAISVVDFLVDAKSSFLIFHTPLPLSSSFDGSCLSGHGQAKNLLSVSHCLEARTLASVSTMPFYWCRSPFIALVHSDAHDAGPSFFFHAREM